jgi:hypothetical protein
LADDGGCDFLNIFFDRRWLLLRAKMMIERAAKAAYVTFLIQSRTV